MSKKYFYILMSLAIGSLFSCQKSMICPAYQSYFILDPEVTRQHFSLFGEDSLPKQIWEVDKKKVGIANAMAYNKKVRKMQTISTHSVYLPMKDPFADYRREFAESDSIVTLDSASILKDYYNDFENVDQIIYLHHYGKYLQKKPAEQEDIEKDLVEKDEPLISKEELNGEEQTPPKKKKFWPFGKKKKNPPPVDENTN